MARRMQKNGRERGNQGNGMGHWSDWNGGHATKTKNKRDQKAREDRKRKSHGWQD